MAVEGLHARENPEDLSLGENHRERPLVFSVKNGEQLPLPVQNGAGVELDAGVAQPQRRRPVGVPNVDTTLGSPDSCRLDPMRVSSEHTTESEDSSSVILLKERV